jgi:hypothetical protein
VRRPLRSKTVRAVYEVFFVDRLQHHGHRPLEDFVLEGRHDPLGLPPRAESLRDRLKSPIRFTLSAASALRF